jgi:hypothetical protein
MSRLRIATRLAIAAAAVGATGCMPQELKLRRASVDWESLGMQSVVVQAVPPTPTAKGTEPTKTASLQASGSISPAMPPADLTVLTRDAAELLAFALAQSAVTVAEIGATTGPRLEVTVQGVALSTEEVEVKEVDASKRPRTLMSIRDEYVYPRQPERVIKATVVARLVDPAQTRPVWFKVAIGTVDLGAARAAQPTAVDPFPPAARLDREDDKEALDFYREIAIRRALKQIADDLLPHYEYVELK